MWSNGSTRLALTAVACALLIACSGGDSPPAPTPVPVSETPTAAGAATATAEPTPVATAATPSPTGTATSAPTATVAVTPTATAAVTPTTTTASAPAPSHWQPTFREVPTEEVFVTRTYAPGEDFSDQVGLFFLDTETGEVEMWSLPAVEGTEQEYRELDIRASWTNRYVYAPAVPALHDRQTGVTVTWSAYDFDFVRDRDVWPRDRYSDSFSLLGWGTGEAERLVVAAHARNEFIVLNTELEAVSSFRISGLSWARSNWLWDDFWFWFSPDRGRIFVIAKYAMYRIDVRTTDIEVIRVPQPDPPVSGFFRVQSSDEGFAIIEECRVIRYSWSTEILSDVQLEGDLCDTFALSLSPDGTRVAMFSALAQSWVYEWFSPLVVPGAMTMTLHDAVTGEILFRARGVGEALSMTTTSPWLPDSSGLFVMVAEPPRLRLLGVDGEWLPLSPGLSGAAGLVPAPHESAIFAANLTTVVDAEGALLSGSARPDGATNLSFLRPWSPWGANSSEMRFGLPDHWWAAADGWSPVMGSPVIERPPFPALTTLEVHATGATCPRLVEDYRRPQPGDKSGPRLMMSDRDRCLEPGSLVELTASEAAWGAIHVLAWKCQEPADAGCLWAFVRTADGTEGWAQIDYLRWVVAEP